MPMPVDLELQVDSLTPYTPRSFQALLWAFGLLYTVEDSDAY